jgi:hypothetical protein
MIAVTLGSREGVSKMSKKLVFVVMALVVALCVSPTVYGQANASFSGTVSDKSGSVIAGASVSVVSQDTGASRATNTDESGHYLITLLPLGSLHGPCRLQGLSERRAKRRPPASG